MLIAAVVCICIGLALGAALTWIVIRAQGAEHVERIARQLTSELHEGSARVADHQREAFLALANERLSSAVAPVAQQLQTFNDAVSAMEKQRIGAYEGLREQIAGLVERNGRMELAASQLASALRNPTARGKWGEVQLRRVVELAGMEAYCDYHEQRTFETGEELGRPDLTVELPGNSRIFVDAKVPLSAYLNAIDATDENARRERFREHAKAFKMHIDALARRGYQRADGSADFVVMFVPGEAFLSAACIEDPNLIEYGAGKSVYVASPLTLMALLRSYALGWQQRAQEENAKKIAQAAAELYDRVRIFLGHFAAVGSALGKAAEAFNKAAGSVESRVLPQGRRVKELGSLPDAELPDIAAVDIAPRELTALDAQPSPRSRQRKLFNDDTVA